MIAGAHATVGPAAAAPAPHAGRMEGNAEIPERIRQVARDPALASHRRDLARFSAGVFAEVGEGLAVAGNIFGGDRAAGESPWGNGSDEAVAVSVLLRIAGQLVGGAAELLDRERHYAAAALIRQLVEVEYVAWAFESRDRDGERWLRSTRKEREEFFRPARIRAAADGHFRGRDYGDHCELGGHPVPGGALLLGTDASAAGELLLADALGHAGRAWDHIVGWAARMQLHGTLVTARTPEMSQRYHEWKRVDPLAVLPPPPEAPPPS